VTDPAATAGSQSSFTAKVPMRWVDLDAQGHVNNALVVDYLQEARVAFLLSGPQPQLLGGCVVVSHQVQYLRPLFFHTDPLQIEVQVGKVGAAQFELGYTIQRHGEVVVTARSLMAAYDVSEHRPRRMSPAERDWLLALSVPLEPFSDLGKWKVGEKAYVQRPQVRWSDLDAYGHVNNAKFFDLIAEARIEMNSARKNLMDEWAAAGLTWLVVRQDVDYLGPLQHRLEPYQVRTGYGRIGRTSVTMIAQIEDPLTDGPEVLARSRTVLVCGDLKGRPIPVPKELAQGIESWRAVPVS
jgi:acyl-CoA thioester hydrolase